MKAKDEKEKEEIKLRFATALDLAIQDLGIPSVRNLSINGSMESAHLQRISTGKVDVSLVTIISVIEALGITTAKFFKVFDNVTPEQKKAFIKKLAEQKRKKSTGG